MRNVAEKTVSIQPWAQPASLAPWLICSHSTWLPSKSPYPRLATTSAQLPPSQPLGTPHQNTGREDRERSFGPPATGCVGSNTSVGSCAAAPWSLSLCLGSHTPGQEPSFWPLKETELPFQALLFHICSQFPQKRGSGLKKNFRVPPRPCLPLLPATAQLWPSCVK